MATRQSGVVPYRISDNGEPTILLITARKSGKWSLPKGHLEPGMTPEESAANEAWEEAGAHGEVTSRELGVYHYQKRGMDKAVTFYPMLITHIEEHWLEEQERERRWASPTKAKLLLEARQMSWLIEALEEWLQDQQDT